MTTALSFTASLIAVTIPGLLLDPNSPATILGFAVVGACLFFGARDYIKPRPSHAQRRG